VLYAWLKPAVKWAQRDDLVFITIQQVNITEEKVDLTPGKLSFTCKAGPEKKEYSVDIDFHADIVVDDSSKILSTAKLFFSLKKKDNGEWPRLLNNKTKQHWLKVDFDKWKDADESEDEEKPDNYDMPGMQGMGAGGPGGGPPGSGFDMEAMMKQMGGGAGGPGGGTPDMAEMMKMMGGMGGGAGGGMPDMSGLNPDLLTGANSAQPGAVDADDEPDSDDEDMPGLE